MISVANGIAFVGEKKLVRIEEAGRTTATAALTGRDAELAAEAATERESARGKADERARRSAAAKKGAAARKARQEAEAAAKAGKARRRRSEGGGRVAAAAGERRSRTRRSSRPRRVQTLGRRRHDGRGRDRPRGGRRRRRRAILSPPAPRPQRRTAPFAREGLRRRRSLRVIRPDMSYAVIKTGGKQYRVEEGQTLLVERLPDEPGATVELDRAPAGRRRRPGDRHRQAGQDAR